MEKQKRAFTQMRIQERSDCKALNYVKNTYTKTHFLLIITHVKLNIINWDQEARMIVLVSFINNLIMN